LLQDFVFIHKTSNQLFHFPFLGVEWGIWPSKIPTPAIPKGLGGTLGLSNSITIGEQGNTGWLNQSRIAIYVRCLYLNMSHL